MRIHIHDEISDQGVKVGEHVIHTEDAVTMALLVPIVKGVRAAAGTGWELPSNHPSYLGKTRLEVLKAEVIRLNDAAARATFGL